MDHGPWQREMLLPRALCAGGDAFGPRKCIGPPNLTAGSVHARECPCRPPPSRPGALGRPEKARRVLVGSEETTSTCMHGRWVWVPQLLAYCSPPAAARGSTNCSCMAVRDTSPRAPRCACARGPGDLHLLPPFDTGNFCYFNFSSNKFHEYSPVRFAEKTS